MWTKETIFLLVASNHRERYYVENQAGCMYDHANDYYLAGLFQDKRTDAKSYDVAHICPQQLDHQTSAYLCMKIIEL